MSRNNPFFNNLYFKPEQDLIQSLVDESISAYGMDVMYIPRNISNFDQLYLTDDQSVYNMAIPCVVYLQNVEGFIGEQNIFSKFSLLIRNSVELAMSKWEWERQIQPVIQQSRPQTYMRPDEGDLIYFPLNDGCFQIKFVNNKELFYPTGVLPSFQLSAELFQYSDETFATGIPEIDKLQKQFSLNAMDYAVGDENNEVIVDENNDVVTNQTFDTHNIDPIADTDYLNFEANGLIDFSKTNPMGSIPVGN
jgi:Virus neck protein